MCLLLHVLALLLASLTLSPPPGVAAAEHGPSWGYDGPNGPQFWKISYPDCGGDNQSPIDIDLGKTEVSPELGPISFRQYDQVLKGAKVVNNGHSVEVEIPNTKSAPYIEGAGLTVPYRLAQFHFHWGKGNTTGSEHTIDKEAFPLELHFVHYSTKYGSAEKAQDQPDGIAVVSILFKVSTKSNLGLEPLVKLLPSLTIPSQEKVDYDSRGTKLSVLLPVNRSPYYRYHGSLTTPPCSEVVIWTILADWAHISNDQLAAFRKLETKGGRSMAPNFRPLQPLHSRRVLVGRAPRGVASTGWAVLAAALAVFIGTRHL